MKKEFLKPSILIHIVHNLSLAQAQVWDFILAQSSPESLLTTSQHTIPLSSIINYLGNTRNHKHVREVLKELGTAITFTLLKKDCRLLYSFKLFSSMQVIDGIVHYSYPQELRKILANPTSYSRINLSMALKFKSKYALSLYQLCIDYKKINETPWFTHETFCRYMDIDADQFPEFYLLNFHKIKKAVEQVNRVSNIIITAQYQKNGRQSVAVKFLIESRH